MRKEISPGAKLCYARLAQYAGADGVCNPKQETLATAIGVSARTVRDYIRELEDNNLIETAQIGLNCANHYYFLEHEWQESALRRVATSADPERQNPAAPERQNPAAPHKYKENQFKEDIHIGVHPSSSQGLSDSGLNGLGLTRMNVQPPTLEEVLSFGISMKISEETCRNFWDFYEGQHSVDPSGLKFWVTSGGAVVTNWKAKLRSFKSQAHQKQNSTPASRIPKTEPAWARRNQLKDELDRLNEEWRMHPANKTGHGERPAMEPTAEQKANFLSVEKRIHEAEVEIRKIR